MHPQGLLTSLQILTVLVKLVLKARNTGEGQYGWKMQTELTLNQSIKMKWTVSQKSLLGAGRLKINSEEPVTSPSHKSKNY